MKNLEAEIESIRERNKKVEIDKAWETSNTRRLVIVGITYVFMTVFFSILDVKDPHINALVPTLGYALSTLSLSVIKNLWIRILYKD